MGFQNVFAQEDLTSEDFALLSDSIMDSSKDVDDKTFWWSGSKEIGLNMTPLISQLVPFNLGSVNAGIIGLNYRKYYNKRAFRLNFGANISESALEEDDPFFYFSIGTEKRTALTKSWHYTSGWDLYISADGEDAEGEIGITKLYGIEYHFNKRVFLSTEGRLRLGLPLEGESPTIKFEIPAAIFFNIRLF
ncbi:MAG: hypothetical protein IPM42_13615 [Saprospiraceae bacterium]|nr:hypothetical protein [Saprospiraceae bacterium]